MFEIGQKVKWKVGQFNIEGCVFGDKGGDNVEVVSHFRNGLPHVQQIKIDRNLLVKI